MPAITVDDLLSLPRIPEPDPVASVERPLVSLTTAPKGFEGEGFPVRRAFAGVDQALLDPFIHLDQMGEVDYGPGEPKGTAWHPHRGFETVTYMIDGAMAHRDSTGGGGLITNGATQWMTAGAGILHIETPPEELVVQGGLFHGLQLWVNLPAAEKWVPPNYQDLDAGQVTLATSADGGTLLRIIAGALGDAHPREADRGEADRGDGAGAGDQLRGPGTTHTPITMVHATVSPGAHLRLPWRRDFNALVYALSGQGTVGPDSTAFHGGQLAAFGPGDLMSVVGDARPAGEPLELIILGGRPIREPVAWYGPFVMNTKAELQQAFEDFQAGRLGRVPA